VKIGILGPLTVEVDGAPADIPGRREQMLLARLALSPGVVVSTDALADAIWGEDLPANPANALQAAVSRLRKTIGKDAVVTRAPGYALDVAPADVDAVRFAELIEQVEHHTGDAMRLESIEHALKLWRGPVLVEFVGEEFAQREIGRLTELHQRAVQLRLEAAIGAGRHAAAIPELERLITADPLRESLRHLHMLALYRAGRQADALRVYRETREVLAEELGVDPGPQLQELELKILDHDPSLAAPGAAPDIGGASSATRHNLPERLTSFIGRDVDIGTIIEALSAGRLVTLLGPGGAGKTSLAVEVARTRIGEHKHGVWLVDLAGAGTDDVAETAAAVLGVDARQAFDLRQADDAAARVIGALHDRQTLLVFDNCEHVIDAAAALIEAILQACRGVVVLATSRERLGVVGEHVHAVPPLMVGAPGETAPPALLVTDAVRLFGERAAAATPGFVLDESNVVDVAAICRRLDGMPLAIELAAARTSSLPVSELAARLDDVFRLLTGGRRTAPERHQTLRATIGWSYALLSVEDREVFDRLSVFRGRFDLAAASAVTRLDELDVLDALQRLIDRSMVVAEPAGRPTYRLLETLRAFAGEQLAASADDESAHRRHFDHFRAIVQAAEPHLRTGRQMEWLRRIDDVIDNVRAALDWSVDHDPASGVGLAGELGWYSYLRGHRAEAGARIGRLLEAGGREAAPADLGKALFTYAMTSESPNLAVHHLDDAAAQFDAVGDRWFATVCRAIAATFRAFYGHVEASIRILEDAGEVMEVIDDDWGRGLVEFFKANLATAQNDFATTAAFVERAQRSFERTGDAWGIGYMDYFRGVIERTYGHYDAAETMFLDALRGARELGLQEEIPVMLGELGNMATLQGDYRRADAYLTEAMDIADRSPFLGSQAMIHNARGLWWRHQGRHRRAYESHVLASRMYTEAVREGGIAFAEGSAGRAAEALGRLSDARRHHLRSLDAALTIGDHPGVAFAAEGMAGVAVAAGASAHGAELLGGAAALRAHLGIALPSGEDFDVRRWEAEAMEDLDAAGFEEARRRGEAMDLDALLTAVRSEFPGLAS
jgi:predicted ATPase/DNA-binding SARP family transcriptional activator